MRKKLLIIPIVILAVLLIGAGAYVSYKLPGATGKNNTEKVLRESKKEKYMGDPTNVEKKLTAEHKYKNITIKDILFQQRGEKYIFEITLENKTTKEFYEPKTNITFYNNLGNKIGSQTIELPVIRQEQAVRQIFEIENESFFDACDFTLIEIK